ncbi:beta strand repeat-containing protein [Microbacterium sp. Root61]|uniref:beta strand repeat-containing protein n=1 Tax=Microbacterium sp. Root61 TaxID=1736570 RepID=UPI001F3FFEAF|nr:hypothetical protein [Microbacterium sp. Root61]
MKTDIVLARVRDRLRTTTRDDSGATLVAVLTLMAVGFIASAIIAAACMFTIAQTAQGRTDAQSFAAAEAGRDAVVSVLSQETASALCTNSAAGIGHFTSAVGQTPVYQAWVQAIDSGTPPTSWQGSVGADDVPAVPSCPTDGTKYIVVRSIGSSAGGGTEVIDAVYKWQLGKETVAGGGLGYQGVSYAATASTIKGDMIVKNGNLECNYGTVFDGSVYVLNGNVNVGADAFFGWGGDACTINGELVVAGTINFERKCTAWFIVCISYAFGTMSVGGPAHVQGSIEAADGGTLNVGTDPIADNPSINDVEDTYTTRDLTLAGHIATGSGGPTITTSNGGSIEAVDYITAGKALTAAGGIATGGNLTATAAVTANGGDISVVGKILGANGVTASASILAGGDIQDSGARTATSGNITTAGSILGSGIVTAGLGITVKGSIGGSRVVKANGGPITVGVDIANSGGTTALGDISVAGAITTASGAVTAGGAVKVLGNIVTASKVDANGGHLQTGGTLDGGVREASGSITTTQPINTASAVTAGENLITNGALAGNGPRTATGGTMSVKGDLGGTGAKNATDFIVTGNLGGGDALATGNLTVNGTISGDGARQALGGALWGDNSGNLSGSGRKSAKYIFVNGNLASGNSVTATENLIVVGNVTNNVAVTATNGTLSIKGAPGSGAKTGGTVLIQGDVSGGAVNATAGNLEITGSVTGSGGLAAVNGRIAVSQNIGSASAPATGAVSSKTGILVGGLINLNTSGGTAGLTTTAPTASVTAVGDIKTTQSTACSVTGDFRAGGILTLPQAGNSWNANTTAYPYCTIGGKLQSASTSKSIFAGSNWRVRVGTTSASTVESAANSVANGWGIPSGSGNARYLKGTASTTPANGTTNVGSPTVNSNTTTNPKPAAPTVVPAFTAPVSGTMTLTSTDGTALTAIAPVVGVPDVTPPSAPPFVLNERTVKTWSDIDDLQLRTTWLDLGTYTDWGPDYFKVTLSGTRCTSWLGLSGQLTRILNTAGEVRETATGAVLVPGDAKNIVIDATGCTNTITMSWAATNLKRDAVILVNNASFDLASMGSQSATRQLFVVQVDKDQSPQRSPRGVVEAVPNCSPGQNRISISGDGIFGDGAFKANVLLYTPCGVSGGWLNNWQGHIYANGSASVDTNVLSKYSCVDMSIPGILSLPCDIDTITDTGHMNIAAYAIGDRLTQTEP